MRRPLTSGPHVELHAPTEDDESEFLAAVAASRALHGLWVAPPDSRAAYTMYLARIREPTHAGFLLRAEKRLVGVVNLNNIVMGSFRSAQLGYYAFSGGERRGYLREGLRLVIDRAFVDLGLHRVEANMQPGNERSRALVRGLGFKHEGLSPRYLLIAGEWRDHERWALTAEDWDLR